MKTKYTQQAIADLATVATFYETRNASLLPKILSDIESKLELIKDYPDAGHQQQDKTVRKAVTRRYRYIIHYRILKATNEIQIIAVRHFRQARTHEDN